jgi:hypothetical protein
MSGAAKPEMAQGNAGSDNITDILRRFEQGDAQARDLLIARVYSELKVIAARHTAARKTGSHAANHRPGQRSLSETGCRQGRQLATTGRIFLPWPQR